VFWVEVYLKFTVRIGVYIQTASRIVLRMHLHLLKRIQMLSQQRQCFGLVEESHDLTGPVNHISSSSKANDQMIKFMGILYHF
jgi:hypothetical protein